MHSQLSEHFNPYLAAVRKGFGRQPALLRLLEDWSKALDNHQSPTAIFMDLTKASDCLPDDLLIENLGLMGWANYVTNYYFFFFYLVNKVSKL